MIINLSNFIKYGIRPNIKFSMSKLMLTLPERLRSIFYVKLPIVMEQVGFECLNEIYLQLASTDRGYGTGKLKESIQVSGPLVTQDSVSVGVAEEIEMPYYWIYQEEGVDPFTVRREINGKIKEWEHPGMKARNFIIAGNRYMSNFGVPKIKDFLRNELRGLR